MKEKMTDKKAVAALRAYADSIPEDMPCGRGDKAAFRRLADLISAGKYKAANAFHERMDTAPRESVPDDVCHHLQVMVAGGVRTIQAYVTAKGCKKVFNPELGPGVIGMVELELPKTATDQQLAMAITERNAEILDSVVEVVYKEGDKELVRMKQGRQ
jgi:hypothetical protein